MSKKICLHTQNAPEAIGPYSQAIEVGGLVYTSGQIALVPETGALVEGGVEAQVVAEQCQVGGGSVPAQLLPTFAVAIAPARCSVDELEQALRLRERPIIGRIAHDRYLLDLRTLREEDFPAVETALFEVLS